MTQMFFVAHGAPIVKRQYDGVNLIEDKSFKNDILCELKINKKKRRVELTQQFYNRS